MVLETQELMRPKKSSETARDSVASSTNTQ